MADFVFVRGNDLTIKLNGEVLGGVQKAVCSTKKTFSDIKEFLTDIPVARVEEKRYEIILNLNIPSLDNLESIESIEISDSAKTVTYTKCNVEETQTTINAKGSIEYRAIISSDMRNVL